LVGGEGQSSHVGVADLDALLVVLGVSFGADLKPGVGRVAVINSMIVR